MVLGRESMAELRGKRECRWGMVLGVRGWISEVIISVRSSCLASEIGSGI